MKNLILAKAKFVFLRQSKAYIVSHSHKYFQCTEFIKNYSRKYCHV